MILFLPLAATIAFAAVPARAEADISVSVVERGFHRHVEIGDTPPVLVHREPIDLREHAQ